MNEAAFSFEILLGVTIAASSSCVLVFVFPFYIEPTGVLLMLMGRSDSCSFQINHKALLICVITGLTLAPEVGQCGVFPASVHFRCVHLHLEQSQDSPVLLSSAPSHSSLVPCPPFLKTSSPSVPPQEIFADQRKHRMLLREKGGKNVWARQRYSYRRQGESKFQ